MGQEVTTSQVRSAIFRTISRPFDPPETGKIAIKVINHYGDKVLEVCSYHVPSHFLPSCWGRLEIILLAHPAPLQAG